MQVHRRHTDPKPWAGWMVRHRWCIVRLGIQPSTKATRTTHLPSTMAITCNAHHIVNQVILLLWTIGSKDQMKLMKKVIVISVCHPRLCTLVKFSVIPVRWPLADKPRYHQTLKPGTNSWKDQIGAINFIKSFTRRRSSKFFYEATKKFSESLRRG